MNPVIAAHDLTKIYGTVPAVDNVSFDTYEGEICGLVGKNGAGKTTLIRMLTGLVKPSSGEFRLMPNKTRSATDVASIVEKPSLYADLTGYQNLCAQSKLLGIAVDARHINSTLELAGIDPALKKPVKNYSLGMKQRLAIAMTIVGRPKLLLLDEPTNGLDPAGIHDVRNLFAKLNKEAGVTVFISSHILSELAKLANVFFFMEKGRLIKSISAQQLENESKSKIRLKCSDTEKAAAVLEQANIVTARSAKDTLEIYSEITSTDLILLLAKNDITVSEILSVGDNLEDYYISLLGGKRQ